MKKAFSFLTNIGRTKNYMHERLRYLTFKRFVNLLKVEWALFRGKPVVHAYPYEVVIDSTNICQLRCPLCSTGGRISSRKRGHMEFDTFKRIMDEVGPHALHIYLHNWGESLLHKEINSFIRYAKNHKVAVSVSTNLSFSLSQDMVDELITSGLDTLVVSVDGVSRETYAKYRIGGNFELVMSNLNLLVERKRALCRKRPFLEWQFLRMKHNIHETNRAKEIAKKIGVDNIAFGVVLLPFGINHKELAASWVPEDEMKTRIRYDLIERDMGRHCWWLWRAVVFNWDGTVSPCCYVDEESAIFGDISKGSFKDIWNNQVYASARKLFSGYMNAGNIVCNRCGMVKTGKV